MKFSLLLLVALCAFVAAQDATSAEPEVSVEGIGKFLKKHLKDIAGEVGRVIISKAKDLLTDSLRVQPTKDVEDAIRDDPSTEGILDIAADIILKTANKLAAEQETEAGPSHEGILYNLGYIHKISEAEELLRVKYNRTYKGEGPSHEGILGSLGGLIINGLGNALGGKYGNAISTAGDFIGNLFFAAPSVASKEGIISEFSQEGLISTAGKILVKGSGRLASGLLKGVFDASENILGNIFLARGAFNNYPNIHAPVNEILLEGRNKIKDHFHNHPEAQVCFDATEQNFTELFDQYTKDGEACVVAGHENSRKILSHVEDIVLDAVKRVEDAHRETGNCFNKDASDDRILCLKSEVPNQIKEHREKILQYGDDLANYVKQFSDLNTDFDVCLVAHLGAVRREVYNIVNDFHNCVSYQVDIPKNEA